MTSTQTAPDHIVTINYAGDIPGPRPNPLRVRLHASVIFKPEAVPPGFRMVVSFDHPEHFSSAIFREGDAPVIVKATPPSGEGTYRCELEDAGLEGKSPTPIPGGSIEADTDQGVTR
jgi:hypothetical protein